ncbi:MAG: hypothetical protein U0802_25195 [Candidatus Binatia bacterium]
MICTAGRAALLVASCLAVAGAAIADTLRTPDEGVEVRIDTVLAGNNGRTFDPALRPLKEPFRGLFPFSSYRLLQAERRMATWRREEQFMLPGQRYLVILPRGVQGDRVSLSVMLMQGSRPLVNTVLSLKNNGVFLVAGPRYDGGVLIFAIGARTKALAVPSLPLSAEGSPHALHGSPTGQP